MKIQIQVRTLYGSEQAYPVCDLARSFAELAGTRTLTRRALSLIVKLGYSVEVVAVGSFGVNILYAMTLAQIARVA
jgi:hypothetical protein